LGQPTYSLAVVLFLLLLSGAAGSRLSPALRVPGRKGATFALFASIAAFVVVLVVFLPALLRASSPWPFPVRVLTCAAAVAPLGFALGVPLPVGLACVARRSESRVPWLWAVNSATSVLGSVLATFAAIHAGIGAALASGAICYLVAGIVAIKVLR
jgi:hypothetical protein